MTTNHTANGPVSLKRLHQISEILSKAAAQSDGGNLGYAMADAVNVIDGAIAAMNANPVAWTTGRYSQNIGCNFGEKVPDEAPCIMSIYWDIDTFRAHTDCDATALRWLEEAIKNTGAKPLYTAPPAPVVPDELTREEYRRRFMMEDNFDDTYRGGWKACRAAMLQAGNSPATPDGWQLVPKEPTEAMNKAGWAAMNEHDAINPTYRAMLAAAPQQDVRLALEIGMSRYAGAMQKLVDSGD